MLRVRKYYEDVEVIKTWISKGIISSKDLEAIEEQAMKIQSA